MSSTPEYDEFLARYKTKNPEKDSKDPRGLMAARLEKVKILRNKVVDKKVTDENRAEVLEDLFAVSKLNFDIGNDYRRYKKTNTKKAEEAVQLYETAGIKKVNLWSGSKDSFKSKILNQANIALTNLLRSDTGPEFNKVNKYFTGMTDPVNPPTLSTVASFGEETELGSELGSEIGSPSSLLSVIKEEEEEKEEIKEAPKDIVEGDEGVISVRGRSISDTPSDTSSEESATFLGGVRGGSSSISPEVKKLAEETLGVLDDPFAGLPIGETPEEKKEEEPSAPPPLPTATEDSTPIPTETTPPVDTDIPTETTPPDTDTTEPEGERTTGGGGGTTPPPNTIPPNTTGVTPTQEFELAAGTRTQPNIEGVLGGIDRGVLSSISTSRREGLSINKLKEDIKDFHKIYNNVIPAFRDKAHQKRKEKALKSKNKREVLQHYEEMENLIANYYKNDGGFKLGVIVSAESLFSGNIFGGSDLYATGMVGANSGATPIDRNSLERGGSTKYNKVVDIEPTYTRGGIDHALQKPVQNKEPKVKKGRVRFDRNINTIPVAVHRPYQHILNRPLKPSYNIKIKGKK